MELAAAAPQGKKDIAGGTTTAYLPHLRRNSRRSKEARLFRRHGFPFILIGHLAYSFMTECYMVEYLTQFPLWCLVTPNGVGIGGAPT